jgi:hypothetical protein
VIQYVLPLVDSLIIAFGGLAAFICFKGYKQNHSFSMLCLTIGFALIVAGPQLGMVLLAFSGLGFWEIQSIESALIAFGFVYILHSIYTRRG